MSESLGIDKKAELGMIMGNPPTSQYHETAKTKLQVAFLEDQVKAAEAQSKAAQGLVTATWALAGFTLALVIVSAMLAYVTWKIPR